MSAFALWLDSTCRGFDLSIALTVHRLWEFADPVCTPVMEFVSWMGNDGVVLVILSLLLCIPGKTRRTGFSMLCSILIGALITNVCLKELVARARPYADADSPFYALWLQLGQHMESDLSFPSGHTTAAFAMCTGLFLSCRRSVSWSAFLFAFAMGISRIYLVVHYPTDVIAGILAGTVAGFFGWTLIRWISGKYPRFFQTAVCSQSDRTT